MTKEQFEENILNLADTMHRISKSLLARPQDRDDAIQNCLLKAWQSRQRLRDLDCFRPWALRILVNECHSLLRKSMRMVPMEMPDEPQEMPDVFLYEAIQALPERYRLPLLLYYVEDFSIKETAQTLRIPEGTVKSRLHKARNELKLTIREEV